MQVKSLMGVIGVVLAATWLGGCSSYSAPTLRVEKVEIGERSPDGLVLKFAIEADNRNDIELPLREVHYALKLDGREVFRGVRSPEASLRRLGTQRIVFPAVVPLKAGEEVPSGLVTFEIEGSLAYTTPGQIAEILFDTGLKRPSVSFRDGGQIDLGK